MSVTLGFFLLFFIFSVGGWFFFGWFNRLLKIDYQGGSRVFAQGTLGILFGLAVSLILFFDVLTFQTMSALVNVNDNHVVSSRPVTTEWKWSEISKAYYRGELAQVDIFTKKLDVVIDPAIAKLHFAVTLVPGKDDESIMALYQRIASRGDTLDAYVRRLTFLYEMEGLSQNIDNFPNHYIEFLKPLVKIVGVKEFTVSVLPDGTTVRTVIE
jgi:hypothetical protein